MIRITVSRMSVLLLATALISCGDRATPSSGEDVISDTVSTPFKKTTPEWVKNAVIYEVDVRKITSEGTFEALEKDLQRIKDLGVDVICLNTIQAHEVVESGDVRIQDFKQVDDRFGTNDDVKQLLTSAHSLGLKVIMDWVSDVSCDHVWMKEGHQHRFDQEDTKGSQRCTIDFGLEEVQESLMFIMGYWVQDVQIDGFRVNTDIAVPESLWSDIRRHCEQVKPLLFVDDGLFSKGLETTFDAYNDRFHGSLMDSFLNGVPNYKTRSFLSFIRSGSGKDSAMTKLSFLGHDMPHTESTIETDMGMAKRQARAVLAATTSGIPFIQNGVEAGMSRSEIHMKNKLDLESPALSGFYKRLFDIRHENEALWNGVHGGYPKMIHSDLDNGVLAYYREKNGELVLTLLNLSDTAQEVTFDANEIEGWYEELFTGDELDLEGSYTERLYPWGYRVYEIRH